MGRLKSLVGNIGRKLSDRLHGVGLQVSPVRDARLAISGLRLGWGESDPRAIPGTIYEHELDGRLMRFFVHGADDVIQQFHAAGHWFDEPELCTIRSFYRGGTFVDIGANVGNHSLYAATVMGAPKVIAFEPVPLIHRVCHYNILLNGLEGRITLHPFGLAEVDGSAVVDRSPARNSGATRLRPEMGGALQLRNGDVVLENEAVGFLKIDVEGGELQVLAGLAGLLARCRPTIHIEVDEENRAAFEGFCKSAAYEIAHVVERETNANFVVVPC